MAKGIKKPMTARTFRSKKSKGIKLEKKVAQLIRLKGLDENARRMPLSGSLDGFKSDIHTTIPLSIECKNCEKHKIWEEWGQAKSQEKPFKPACLIISGNYRPILAVMELDKLLDLLVINEQ